MKTEKEKIYKVGQKIEYSFTEILDYRFVEIELLYTDSETGIRYARFKNKTGNWELSENRIKQPDFKPGEKVKTCGLMGELIYC